MAANADRRVIDGPQSLARIAPPARLAPSLFQPAPSGQAYACCQPECPYFQCDPRLDPADLPHPGWLFDVERASWGAASWSAWEKPLRPLPDVGNVPMATLDWTISPRFELGYRLPSGFGEFDIAYRFLLRRGAAPRHSAQPQAPTRPPR